MSDRLTRTNKHVYHPGLAALKWVQTALTFREQNYVLTNQIWHPTIFSQQFRLCVKQSDH